MSYRFIQVPKYIEPEAYQSTIDKCVDLLSKEESLVSLFKLGNVNHPGISDIDLFAVFKNGVKCTLRPEDSFDQTDRYLITHSIAGASEDDFRRSLDNTIWDNLECIYGKDFPAEKGHGHDSEKLKALKVQTALEFLYKHYIDLKLQLSYGVIKLRTVLQHIKGVRYDIAFLGVENSPLQAFVKEAIYLLDNWFENEFNPIEFSNWIDQYFETLSSSLEKLKKQFTLYLPNKQVFNYGKNVKVIQHVSLEIEKKGLFLNPALISKHKKFFNAHLRLNHFKVKLPYRAYEADSYLEKRFSFFKDYKQYNREYLPHFSAFFPSLNHQLI